MKCSQYLFISSALVACVACSPETLPADSSSAADDEGSSGIGIGSNSAEESGTSGATTTSTTSLGEGEADSLFPSTTVGTESSDEGMVCGEATFVLEAVPPNVVLVLDKSGSMVIEEWDGDQDPSTPDVSRWHSLHNVVSFILGTFDEEVNFGATLFPAKDARSELSQAACVVAAEPDVAVAPQNGDTILATIPGAKAGLSAIQGGTPATAGIQTALEHLRTLDPTVDRFMILVTDGAANCSAAYDDCPSYGCDLFEAYDENLPTMVASAYTDDGIPTFVVGIDIVNAITGESEFDGKPAVNTFEKLNEIAIAGGRGRDGDEKFFNALNEADLQEALQLIAGQVVSCTIPLDPEPVHPNFVEVEIDGQPVARTTDCATEDGWTFLNEGDYGAIRLCNAACDMLGLGGSLDAIYGCPPAG